jgi:hypothetical protein
MWPGNDDAFTDINKDGFSDKFDGKDDGDQ